MKNDDVEQKQKEVCMQHGVEWSPAPGHLKVGVSLNVKSSMIPVNGLRHPAEGDSTGWYIWAGEGNPSSDPDFFVPLHVEHLLQWRPEILKFLGLPAGWRFLTDGKHEDVWEDPSLLNVT
jgi:hypothetical protein